MKKPFVFLLFFFTNIVFSQTKETVNAKIDKALSFYESKKDSIKILAEEIRKEANQLGLKREASYFYRFMGFYYEYDGKLDEAVKSYLTFLGEAEKNEYISEKYQAIGDISSVYQITKQFDKAKKLLLKGIKESKTDNPKPITISAFYTNLGVIYRKESKYDSALINYNAALKIKKEIKDSVGEANVNINIATLLINEERYKEAISYVDKSIIFHQKNKSDEDLWFDYMNLSEIYLRLNRKNESEFYVKECLKIAKKIDSKTKEHESTGDLSKLYGYFGDYKKAYQYYAVYDSLGKTILNSETNKSIADLREKYESDKKEQENVILNQQVEQQKQKQLLYIIGLIGLLLFSAIIAYFLWKNNQKNKLLNEKNNLIEHQNQKLSDLNIEKNILISMVSHDLSTPFLTIKTWNSILQKNIDKNNLKAIEASEIIHKGAEQGISLIKNILNIEKAETNQHDLKFEKVDLNEIIKEEIASFQEIAKPKNIEIIYSKTNHSIEILSDKHLIIRILENLVSNAIKFSEPNKRVWIDLKDENNKISISIKDEGIGITAEDIPKLFTKYGTTASKTTANENSTGLGLSIVKRILDEIGGQISVKSEKNIGSEFVVILTK